MNRLFRHLSSIAMLLSVAAFAAAQETKPSASSVVDIDRIVAVVNDEVITRIELDRESRMAVEQLRRQGT
ncbi:MAG TPA: molecular chaperone SurA, partial [Burkholderiales bacterium]|nr:molecular chaperone SurA [Burkholderiales bacterium]